MSWFLRGVQSAIFHYASCAPCTGYQDSVRRRREAKRARKAREQLVLEQPETYHHPEPTGTNPFWAEEMALGPGPPSRRARRTATGSSRGRVPAALRSGGSQGSQGSRGSHKGSSGDEGDAQHRLRLSDDTLDDETWNLKRYQREDEQLWGLDDAPMPVQHTTSGSSSSGLGSVLGYRTSRASRPCTSPAGSYCSPRAPPVNDLHPPVVSLPSPDAADNRWMLQPPPKASVMAGRERATHRSRSGSGASSRVELSLQRQLSTRQLLHRLERGHTQELPSMSPAASHTDLVATQRRNRSRTPQPRPPSSTSSRSRPRRDTATTLNRTDTTDSHASSRRDPSTTPAVSRTVSVRRPALSTVVSSGSAGDENAAPERPAAAAAAPTPPPPPPPPPHPSSDVSSLHHLQDTVSPRALLASRFVSAPLLEAKIRLPPSTDDLISTNTRTERPHPDADADADADDEPLRAPFDSRGVIERDPTLRWSVDF